MRHVSWVLTLGLVLSACTQHDGDQGGSETSSVGTSTDSGTEESAGTSGTETGTMPDLPPPDPGSPTGPLYALVNVQAGGLIDHLEVIDLAAEDLSPTVVLDPDQAGAQLRVGDSAFTDSLGLHVIGTPNSNRAYVHDLATNPLGTMTLLEDIPAAANHTYLSEDQTTLVVHSARGSGDELRAARLMGTSIGPFNVMPDTPPELYPTVVLSADGHWLSFAGGDIDGPDQLYVSEIIDGVLQPAVALTALMLNEQVFPIAVNDDQVFFHVTLAFSSTLHYVDLSNWPMVAPQPVFDDSPTITNGWGIDRTGTRVLHVHNTDGELDGDIDLIEITGGQIAAGQPIDTPTTVLNQTVRFSGNQRFGLFINFDEELMAVDLDGAPLSATVLGDLHFDFQMHALPIGDWVAWADPNGAMLATRLADAIEPTLTISPPGVDINEVAVDHNRGRVLGKADDGRVWVVDLSGASPSAPRSVPTSIDDDMFDTWYIVPSPIDDWIFYGFITDGGSQLNVVTQLWGQDPAISVGRIFREPAHIIDVHLFAPGIGHASSLF